MLMVNQLNGFGASAGPRDPYWGYVTSLGMPMASDSTYTVDAKGNPLTATPGCYLISGGPFPGMNQFYFNGTNGRLTINNSNLFNIGTRDYFFEFYASFSGFSQSSTINTLLNGSSTNGPFMYYVNNGGSSNIQSGQRGGGDPSATISIGLNDRRHFAVGRKNGITYLFNNGIMLAQTSNVMTFGIGEVFFGEWDGPGQFAFTGNLGPWRMTDGVCRFTADFALPTSPFPTR